MCSPVERIGQGSSTLKTGCRLPRRSFPTTSLTSWHSLLGASTISMSVSIHMSHRQGNSRSGVMRATPSSTGTVSSPQPWMAGNSIRCGVYASPDLVQVYYAVGSSHLPMGCPKWYLHQKSAISSTIGADAGISPPPYRGSYRSAYSLATRYPQ
jgi:hypothetical protein